MLLGIAQWTSRKVKISVNQYDMFLHTHAVNFDLWHVQDAIESMEASPGRIQALTNHIFSFHSMITGSRRKRVITETVEEQVRIYNGWPHLHH